MAKKKKGQLKLPLGLNDERVPKLFGVLSLFFALYLMIAFTSYLFTWKIDQDKVFDFSWKLLSTDLEMANWLGRLGAIISDKFFYWGFGLASFGFVYLLGTMGLHLIHRRPFRTFAPTLSRGLILILVVSIFLAFVLGQGGFPWGGAFGEGVAGWLENFVGTIGLIFLFLLVIVMVLIWKLNPNFSELSFSQVVDELKDYVTNILSRKPARKTSPANNNGAPSALRPGNNTALPKPEPLPEPSPLAVRGEQLAFELDEEQQLAAAKRAEILRSRDAELEIQDVQEQP
ncbi:MAG: DNA translocase FtsK 4TM domain-containing protein, partial [Sinomicrobium sp.]|nr:DNA translocase FtsK 4TM domain-containing protein [Sinomicrobium sp.]